MALGSTCNTNVYSFELKLVRNKSYPGDVKLADVRSLRYLGRSSGNIIPILLSRLSPANHGSDKQTQSMITAETSLLEIPALTTTVFALPAGRRLPHVGHLLLYFLTLGFLVDLVDGLRPSIFSPLDPGVLT